MDRFNQLMISKGNPKPRSWGVGFLNENQVKLIEGITTVPDPRTDISLMINIYFLFCRTNSVRDLIFV
jgi:hypothetical protein